MGWGQPDLLRGLTGQKVQGCSRLGRFHSPDLHPWPHRTNPHLNEEGKMNQACWSQAQIITTETQCVYLWDFLSGGNVLMLMRMGPPLTRLQIHQMQVKCVKWKKLFAELYENLCAHSLCQEGPNLDLWHWGLRHSSGVHPRSQGAPTEEGGYWRLAVCSRVDLPSGWCCCLLSWWREGLKDNQTSTFLKFRYTEEWFW